MIIHPIHHKEQITLPIWPHFLMLISSITTPDNPEDARTASIMIWKTPSGKRNRIRRPRKSRIDYLTCFIATVIGLLLDNSPFVFIVYYFL